MNEQQIFSEARLRDSTERLEFVRRQCAGNEELQSRVENLLNAIDAEGCLFDQQPESILRHMSSGGAVTHPMDPGLDPVERVLELLEPVVGGTYPGRFGHYAVTGIIGRGGFGVVLKAVDQKLQRQVAIKVLSPVLARDEVHRQRFLEEARSAAAVRHANVVQIYAVEERPLPYIVMELVEGQTLKELLSESGPLPSHEVIALAIQISRGLHAAHSQRIVHRDIKPANILVESGDLPSVKLTDFGLAHAVDDDNVGLQKVVFGTPAYMSPEQARGEATDHRSDLFSLGSVLYLMCCGRPAFSESDTMALLKSVKKNTPIRLSQRPAEVPSELVHVVEKLHQDDPSLRYQSAVELIQDLQSIVLPRRFAGVSHVLRPAWITIATVTLAAIWMLNSALDHRIQKTGVVESHPLPTIDFQPVDDQVRAEQQVYDVIADMTRKNPTFDPRLIDYQITDGRVTFFRSVWAEDFSPLAALKDLNRLELYCIEGVGTATDLSFVSGMKKLNSLITDGLPLAGLEPLRGLPLNELSIWCWNWEGRYCDGDLSPLRGLPLSRFNAGGGSIRSLEPLRGARLTELCLNTTTVTDLSPLEDMKSLKILTVANTGVDDLRPLSHLNLRELELADTRVRDISPLSNVPLCILSIRGLEIDDYSSLTNMPLTSLRMDYDPLWDRLLLDELPQLQQLNNRQVDHFRQPDAILERVSNELTSVALFVREHIASF